MDNIDFTGCELNTGQTSYGKVFYKITSRRYFKKSYFIFNQPCYCWIKIFFTDEKERETMRQIITNFITQGNLKLYQIKNFAIERNLLVKVTWYDVTLGSHYIPFWNGKKATKFNMYY